ncbi:tumor susceptibility gene 101 protein [Astyanax mexicanus]|uniref:tumor susceptibility gene 101 protein n=1 Tax=Astyanax mexicanus TaxID=7994 RepID=UPI000BBDB7C3|nr:tumor susceptibility gene 101 protein [Astyanax mexicanus]
MTVTSIGSVKKVLPKTYHHRKRLLSEVMVVMSRYKYLEPVMDRFVFNNGTAKDLLSLVGTVTVLYQGRLYNIPLCLWLDESFPRTAPICFVKPTKEMMIVPSTHVNSDGQIMLPYLEEWRHSQCDLHSLIQVLMSIFGEAPPLVMRPVSEEEPMKHFHACSVENNCSHMTVWREDGLPFQGKNETIC